MAYATVITVKVLHEDDHTTVRTFATSGRAASRQALAKIFGNSPEFAFIESSPGQWPLRFPRLSIISRLPGTSSVRGVAGRIDDVPADVLTLTEDLQAFIQPLRYLDVTTFIELMPARNPTPTMTLTEALAEIPTTLRLALDFSQPPRCALYLGRRQVAAATAPAMPQAILLALDAHFEQTHDFAKTQRPLLTEDGNWPKDRTFI